VGAGDLLGEAAFLFGAGAVGGAATSAGAIATLISYPALLAVGVPALAANMTNAVAVVGTGLGATAASRRELAGTRPRLARWSVAIVGGAVAGAMLLLTTSDGVFRWLVPFLVAGAAAAMLAQPRIARWRGARGTDSERSLLGVALFAVGIYDGYFGAASGIMTLALLLVMVEPHITRANALKNVLLAMADLAVAVVFVIFGAVVWRSAVPLAVGFLVGGAIGPAVARRTPAAALRTVIAIAAFGLAISLFVSAVRSS
jgi:uncharacterized membrane protein YfcA